MIKTQLISLLCFCLVACQHQVESNSSFPIDKNWSFSQVGKGEWYSAQVPGTVHTDLLINGLIDDPYWENNELKQQWIERENWVYKTEFELTTSQLAHQAIEIDFKGLDTYAEIRLNGRLILEADNMFRSWQIDVKPYLVEGVNHLEILFQSPLNVNETRVKNYPYQLPSGCETGDLQVGSFTRKAAYHFGWDWGTALCDSWYLETYRTSFLEYSKDYRCPLSDLRDFR